MRRKIVLSIAVASLVGLVACGERPGTRAVTGGLLGAGAGAAIGAKALSDGTSFLLLGTLPPVVEHE